MLTVPIGYDQTHLRPPVRELGIPPCTPDGALVWLGQRNMPLRQLERRLAAVLVADVVGYTRLMEADEEDTHARLMRLRLELLEPTVTEHSGRVVKNTGDGFIAIFADVVEATRCAAALQQTLTTLGTREPPDRRIAFRIGLNLCDTIIEADDVYGEGVNVAARLQAYAEPGGGVCGARAW